MIILLLLLLLTPLPPFPLPASLLRLPRRERQQLLRVRDAVQPDALRKRDVLCQDTQQGISQVPCKEIQQDRAVHRVSRMFRHSTSNSSKIEIVFLELLYFFSCRSKFHKKKKLKRTPSNLAWLACASTSRLPDDLRFKTTLKAAYRLENKQLRCFGTIPPDICPPQ